MKSLTQVGVVLTGAVAIVAGMLSAAPASLAAGGVALSANVPAYATPANRVGSAVGSAPALVSIYLADRNAGALSAFLAAVNTPGSAEFHHFMTPAQFRAEFAPSQSTAAAAAAFLSHAGLKVGYTPANHAYVDATGTVSQLAKAFGVTENTYRYQGHVLRANANAPTLPATLARYVSFVGGLDETTLLAAPAGIGGDGPNASPGYGYATPAPCSTSFGDTTGTPTPTPALYPATQPWVPCGYTPTQVRAAYHVPATLTGSGVTIGIVDAFASPTIVSDVNTFSAHYGLPALTSANFTQLVTPGTFHAGESLLDPQGWYSEESLDVDWSHSMAPGAHIIFDGANNNETPLDHALTDLIDSGRAQVISNSWGFAGEPTQYGFYKPTEAAFQQAAATGITVLFSSGDNGDSADITGTAGADYPASSPWVTAVGGTTLLIPASGAATSYGWGTYHETLTGETAASRYQNVVDPAGSGWTQPSFFYGSGGGVSHLFAEPNYQKTTVPSALSGGARVVPDISMQADPNTGALFGETYRISGVALIDQGCTKLSSTQEYCERRIGGTSLASPTFAGVVALAIEAGGKSLGFLNPALYGMGDAAGSAIQDVLAPASPMSMLRNVGIYDGKLTATLRTINSTVTGSTVVEGVDSSLLTTTGYDDVTGLGTASDVGSFVVALAAAG